VSAIVLRAALAGEEAELTELALRSKGHWGYSAEFLEACRPELTVRPEQLPGILVAESDGVVAGFRTLSITGAHGELESLFVDLPFIGSGVGRLLLDEVLATARSLGVQTLILDADPGAEAFYARFGARTTGLTPSGSIPGRSLPRMEFDLRA
jgi:GNAT superfamily N-acetyltransferase